jgi:hypothetical protein
MITKIIAFLGDLGIAIVATAACRGLANTGHSDLIGYVALACLGSALCWTGHWLIAGEAFSESVAQGLLCLFVPFYAPLYGSRKCPECVGVWVCGFLLSIGTQFAAAQALRNLPLAQFPPGPADPRDLVAGGRSQEERMRNARIAPPPSFVPARRNPRPQMPAPATPEPGTAQPAQPVEPAQPADTETSVATLPPAIAHPSHVVGAKPQNNPRQAKERPEPKTFRDYVARNYSDWLGDDAVLTSGMRWLPVAKRPAMAVRWGLGVTMGSLTPPSPVISPEELTRVTGPVGLDFVRLLLRRLDSQRDGAWSKVPNEQFVKLPVFFAESEEDLLAVAASASLDGLVLISMTSQRIGLTKTPRETMVVRLADVMAHKITWSSAPLNSQKAVKTRGTSEDASVELVKSVEEKLAEQYGLVPLPSISEAAAQQRAARLAESGGGAELLLRRLVELRYYQAKKLLKTEDAEHAYTALIGDKAKIIAHGEGAERAAAVEDWFRSQK